MSLTDRQGKTWAHSTTVKAGDVLIADGGFTSICEGGRRIVKHFEGRLWVDPDSPPDPLARLYVDTDNGERFFINAQVGEDGELIGFYPA